MTDGELRIELVTPDAAESIENWQRIHNEIVPTDPLSLEQVTERAKCNQLHLGFVDKVAVACSTVRPPSDNAVVVIVRVVATARRMGIGSELYAYLLNHDWVASAKAIETVVLASNPAGLSYALHRQFEIIDDYEIDGARYIDLRWDRSPIDSSAKRKSA